MWAGAIPQSISQRCVYWQSGRPTVYRTAAHTRSRLCRDSLKQAVPLPRHIMLVCVPSDDSDSAKGHVQETTSLTQCHCVEIKAQKYPLATCYGWSLAVTIAGMKVRLAVHIP